MKKIFYLSLITALVAVLGTGCKKSFLDRPPIDQLTTGNFYNNDDEVLAATTALYNIVWFDYNDKAFLAFGEARGGNLQSNDRTPYIQFAVSATDQSTLLPGYKSFYKIISQSNLIMQNVYNSKGNVSQAVRDEALGECHFMRGLAYYYLVSNWGAVPIIYDNLAQLNDSVHRNTIESVWQFIIRDFQYAVKYLPYQAAGQGRINKWSAEGMLAKMYLTLAGYGRTEGNRNQTYLDSARILAGDVIHNSGMSLFPSYYGLFVSANNNSAHNNPESLFSLEWMPFNQPWGVNNSFQAYVAFEPKLTETGDGWGAAQGVSADVVRYYMAHPEDSLRRKATCMFDGDYYPDLETSYGGLQYNVTSISNIKKYVIGSPKDNGGNGAFMAAYINTYMLRLAEVYLIYAEAILGNNTSTTDPEALKYFNAVRQRAGLAPKSVITFDDIFQEKRAETIMEGEAWYDILRWYYFAPQKAMAYVANQDRGSYTIQYIPGTSNPRQYNVTYSPAHYSFDATTVYLPYPEQELINAPSLNDPPVPFDFSKLPNY
ncbi:MAG: RagB/SusD family nutrient uptake outer membrane protein [Thermoflavifilum sp.]|uniref:RagB/SusD family nutrient uptake outer membrane protein n=1 Tax=Thermoflavifilum sp. TaxID=1968839 RepID=UPI0018A5C31F|nr:RagB/SusD family nutrient uptake outer membrane protein [Thermoflavifilum sp.]QOR76658.1 MAG: RagB/SusD family nutrient uptake outer membrane protein [Thermoflavifilum sp.]